jgi:hypothetical protein
MFFIYCKNELVKIEKTKIKRYIYNVLRGSNSAVECQLPKLNVAGSIPVSRSNMKDERTVRPFLCRLPYLLWPEITSAPSRQHRGA